MSPLAFTYGIDVDSLPLVLVRNYDKLTELTVNFMTIRRPFNDPVVQGKLV